MLVDEHYSNVFSLLRESVEGLVDGRLLGLRIDNEKVLLGIRRIRHMSNTS